MDDQCWINGKWFGWFMIGAVATFLSGVAVFFIWAFATRLRDVGIF